MACQCIWPVGAELGEGPVWSAAEQAVWCVDIKGRAVHRFQVLTGQARTWPTPAQVGFIVPAADGGWIAGLKSGLHRFDPESGAFSLLMEIEPQAVDNRLNDGFVDAQGRLWFGSMHDDETALSGVLYRWDERGVRRMDAGYCITNGPAVSHDGRTLYHTDTLRRLIYAFDLRDDGSLANRRVFAAIEDGAGYPDGPSVDAEGCVWTGLFAGWGARRYSPKGETIDFVRFPCANVTKIAFGGAGLKTAYATTAWKGLTADERQAQPLAGGLFRFEVDTPGLPQHHVRHA